jgi:hypothetical protein
MQGTAKGIRLSIVLLFSLLFVFCSTDDPSSDDAEKEWTWVPYDSDLFRISGRANFEKGDFVVLSWSASSITVAFVGTALEVKIGRTMSFSWTSLWMGKRILLLQYPLLLAKKLLWFLLFPVCLMARMS